MNPYLLWSGLNSLTSDKVYKQNVDSFRLEKLLQIGKAFIVEWNFDN